MKNALTPDVIRAQREYAQFEIEKAQQTIARMQGVLADADAAERLLALVTTGEPLEAQTPLMPNGDFDASLARLDRMTSAGNPFRAGTNKAIIWQVLYEAPEIWLTANEIQDRAIGFRAQEIPMASISPMLSEMKGEYIERDNLRVALKSRLNENGEAEASPEADEVAASSNDPIKDLIG